MALKPYKVDDTLNIGPPKSKIPGNRPPQGAGAGGLIGNAVGKARTTAPNKPSNGSQTPQGSLGRYGAAPDSSVARNITGLLSSNSPFVQQARTRTKQDFNRRGLLNSSMAVQAGEQAAVNTALPIAQQDSAQAQERGLLSQDADLKLRAQTQAEGSKSELLEKDIAGQLTAQTQAEGSKAGLLDRQLSGDLVAQTQKEAATSAIADKQIAGNTALKNLDIESQQAIAAMNVDSNDRDRATSISAVMLGSINSARSAIHANTALPAEARDAALVDLAEREQAALDLVSQLYEVNIDWPGSGGGGQIEPPANPNGGGSPDSQALYPAGYDTNTPRFIDDPNFTPPPEFIQGAPIYTAFSDGEGDDENFWTELTGYEQVPNPDFGAGPGQVQNPDFLAPRGYPAGYDPDTPETIPEFDGAAYLAQYPDVAADPYYAEHPLEHYQAYGEAEGRTPSYTDNQVPNPDYLERSDDYLTVNIPPVTDINGETFDFVNRTAADRLLSASIVSNMTPGYQQYVATAISNVTPPEMLSSLGIDPAMFANIPLSGTFESMASIVNQVTGQNFTGTDLFTGAVSALAGAVPGAVLGALIDIGAGRINEGVLEGIYGIFGFLFGGPLGSLFLYYVGKKIGQSMDAGTLSEQAAQAAQAAMDAVQANLDAHAGLSEGDSSTNDTTFTHASSGEAWLVGNAMSQAGYGISGSAAAETAGLGGDAGGTNSSIAAIQAQLAAAQTAAASQSAAAASNAAVGSLAAEAAGLGSNAGGASTSIASIQAAIEQARIAAQAASNAAVGSTGTNITWSHPSFKEDMRPSGPLLDKIDALNVERWTYKPEFGGAQHIGPYADQFQELFNIGDGVTLDLNDALGVALGAIKELSAKVRELEARG